MPTFVWIRLEIILGLHAKYFSQKAKTDINNVINYSCQFLIVSTTKTAAIPPPPPRGRGLSSKAFDNKLLNRSFLTAFFHNRKRHLWK